MRTRQSFRSIKALMLILFLFLFFGMTSALLTTYTDVVSAENFLNLVFTQTRDITDWENLGLYGGQVNHVAFSPTEGVVYLSGMGKIFRSSDFAQTWTEFSEGGAVAVSMIDGRILIADGGIKVSLDGGITWQTNPQVEGPIWNITLDPYDPLVTFVGTGDGEIYRTMDGGASWTMVDVNPDQAITAIAINPLNTNEVWAVGGLSVKDLDFSAVFHSTDRGEKFDEILNNDDPKRYGQVLVDPDGTVFVSGDSGVLIKKNDKDSFTQTLTSSVWRMSLHPTTGVVYVDNHQSLGGEVWNQNGMPWLFGIDPQNPQIMLAESGQGLRRSVDGGQTWEEANTGLTGVLVTKVKSNPVNGEHLFATTQNGLARSIDNGATWDFPILMGGEARNAWAIVIHPTEPNIVYVGENGGSTVWRSVDSGDTWSQTQLNEKFSSIWQMAIDPNNPDIVYAALASFQNDTSQDGLYATTNGDQTWDLAGLGGQQVNAVNAVADEIGTTVYAGVGDQWFGQTAGGVYRRRAGEVEWTQLGPKDAVVYDIAIDPNDPQHLYIGVGTQKPDQMPGGIFESYDAGESWVHIFITDYVIYTIAIDPQQTNVIFASAGDYIYRSNNGGATWMEYYYRKGANFQALFIPNTVDTDEAPISSANQRYAQNPNGLMSTLYLGADTGLYRRYIEIFYEVYLPLVHHP
jgi:photosystem II stability/assembly factor-like uncharacterized protein